MKKSRVKTVNNELRILIISTLLFVFSCPVGMLVVITVQDHHAQDDYDEIDNPDEMLEQLTGDDENEQPAADVTLAPSEADDEASDDSTNSEEAPAAEATQAPSEEAPDGEAEPTEAATEALPAE